MAQTLGRAFLNLRVIRRCLHNDKCTHIKLIPILKFIPILKDDYTNQHITKPHELTQLFLDMVNILFLD